MKVQRGEWRERNKRVSRAQIWGYFRWKRGHVLWKCTSGELWDLCKVSYIYFYNSIWYCIVDENALWFFYRDGKASRECISSALKETDFLMLASLLYFVKHRNASIVKGATNVRVTRAQVFRFLSLRPDFKLVRSPDTSAFGFQKVTYELRISAALYICIFCDIIDIKVRYDSTRKAS